RLWKGRKLWKPVPLFLLALPVGFFFPQALGSGHALLNEITLSAAIGLLLLLLVVKFLFSLLSFASGAPGGIFFPLLVMGALIGAVFGLIAIRGLGVDEGLFFSFVCLSMTGFFSAIVRAPITGILLLTEMTGSFAHLLPFALVSMTAYIVANAMKNPPVYDALLEAMLRRSEENA
ncbi:MAG: chloride channel protein, partial [Deltaproteobacteria bacterium]|nr:chloride channel protein [Deltaproteobacteria bacterium]